MFGTLSAEYISLLSPRHLRGRDGLFSWRHTVGHGFNWTYIGRMSPSDYSSKHSFIGGPIIKRDYLWIECKSPSHDKPPGWKDALSQAATRL